jgi:Leucine-rich repeat (LRR) protein
MRAHFVLTAILIAIEPTPVPKSGDGRATDESIRALAGQVHILDLGSSAITNRGVAGIVGLKELWYLNLSDTRITDEAIPVLAELPNLRVLNVASTDLSDAACEEMPRLKSLTGLSLNHTDVTSGGVASLVGCDKLTSLSLRDTDIGDRCIDDLCKLKSLTELDLRDTRVTVDGVKVLRRTFGDRCTIEYGKSKPVGDCWVPEPSRRRRPGR